MTEQPKIKFKRAGSKLEIREFNRIPAKERKEAFNTQHTGWLNGVYYQKGRPIMAV